MGNHSRKVKALLLIKYEQFIGEKQIAMVRQQSLQISSLEILTTRGGRRHRERK